MGLRVLCSCFDWCLGESVVLMAVLMAVLMGVILLMGLSLYGSVFTLIETSQFFVNYYYTADTIWVKSKVRSIYVVQF
jgi:hypothetical protein